MQLDELPPLDDVPGWVRRGLRSLDTEAGARRLRYVIALLLLASVAVLVGRGGSRPRDPSFADQPAGSTSSGLAPAGSSGSSASTRSLPGFGEAALTVRSSLGTRTWCVAVASTEPQHQQGLMGRHDLGGYDAMAFRFPTDSTAPFYMRNTPLPLSIAWFDGRGRFVSATDMEPCPDREGCPTYAAAGPYRLALEVPKGGLAGMGIGAGSSASLGGACG